MKQTNVEFVTNIMEFGRSGPLIQPFVIEALDHYAKQVVLNREHIIESMSTGFISGEAWVRCAEEVVEKIKTRS